MGHKIVSSKSLSEVLSGFEYIIPCQEIVMDQNLPITKDQIFYLSPQEISLENFNAPGFILDIGGGGEGIIGQLKGSQVIAIDTHPDELKFSAPGPLKIIMDARDLKFLDSSLYTATGFFCFMFIRQSDHLQVMREIFRVLDYGGKFFIWDAILPPRPTATDKRIIAFKLKVRLPNRVIDTGYGTLWPDQAFDLEYYCALAEQAGFIILNHRENRQTFSLELTKQEI
jgi:SAM-dependent methyltransferase